MPLNAAWYPLHYSQCVERPYYPCAVLSPYSCINRDRSPTGRLSARVCGDNQKRYTPGFTALTERGVVPHSRLSGAMVEETERSFLVICHAGRAQMRCICCQPSPAGFNNPR